MIREDNEHMKSFLVILGAVLFLGGFFLLLTASSPDGTFKIDDPFKVLGVLIVVGTIVGLTLRKN
jgi:hypothetical protein